MEYDYTKKNCSYASFVTELSTESNMNRRSASVEVTWAKVVVLLSGKNRTHH